MRGRRIKFKLSESDIKKVIFEVKGYEKSMSGKLDRFLEYVGEKAVTYAKSRVPVLTGDFKESIHYEYVKAAKRLIIRADDPKAIFYEFGTGVRGAGSPHPEPPLKWQYGSPGEEALPGWWFPITDDEMELLEKYNFIISTDPETGQKFAFTVGQESHPVFYDTREYVRTYLLPQAKEWLK